MWQNLFENIAAPLARRLGTASAAALSSYGATAEIVNAVEIVVIWAVGLAIDLLFSKVNRSHFRQAVLMGLR